MEIKRSNRNFFLDRLHTWLKARHTHPDIRLSLTFKQLLRLKSRHAHVKFVTLNSRLRSLWIWLENRHTCVQFWLFLPCKRLLIVCIVRWNILKTGVLISRIRIPSCVLKFRYALLWVYVLVLIDKSEFRVLRVGCLLRCIFYG